MDLHIHDLRQCGMPLIMQCACAELPKAAVFNCQRANLGAQGPTEADVLRLGPISDLLREQLNDTGHYEIVSKTPVKADVAKADLRACGGCANDVARRLGADVAIIGEIQKVSSLILNIDVKDLRSDTPGRAYSVDIRGDNDTSCDHG